jgi:hypothetical protein
LFEDEGQLLKATGFGVGDADERVLFYYRVLGRIKRWNFQKKVWRAPRALKVYGASRKVVPS